MFPQLGGNRIRTPTLIHLTPKPIYLRALPNGLQVRRTIKGRWGVREAAVQRQGWWGETDAIALRKTQSQSTANQQCPKELGRTAPRESGPLDRLGKHIPFLKPWLPSSALVSPNSLAGGPQPNSSVIPFPSSVPTSPPASHKPSAHLFPAQPSTFMPLCSPCIAWVPTHPSQAPLVVTSPKGFELYVSAVWHPPSLLGCCPSLCFVSQFPGLGRNDSPPLTPPPRPGSRASMTQI